MLSATYLSNREKSSARIALIACVIFVSLLQSSSHREEIWDSKIAACLARRVMELEERDFSLPMTRCVSFASRISVSNIAIIAGLALTQSLDFTSGSGSKWWSASKLMLSSPQRHKVLAGKHGSHSPGRRLPLSVYRS